MAKESADKQAKLDEILTSGVNFVIIRNWDRTIDSLQRQVGVETLVIQMGFDLQTLVATLNREFPESLSVHSEYNAAGEKTEDVVVETMTANNRPLDRLLVMAYPPAANPSPAEMTRFKAGGEVILVTEGEAEITFATRVMGNFISRSDLKPEKVRKGDLIISTDTPNNWTGIDGNEFSFIYFVGNPGGPQRYGDVPKVKVSIQ